MRKGPSIMLIAALIAIPLVLCFVVLPTQTEACVDGKTAKDFLNVTMEAEVGDHMARSFDTGSGGSIEVTKKGNGTLRILSDEQMSNYSMDGDFTALLSIDGEEGSDWVEFDGGKYWAVLENANGTDTVVSQVYIHRPAEKCGSNDPSFVPGFGATATFFGSAGMVALLALTRTRG